jgi:hypothetical protein
VIQRLVGGTVFKPNPPGRTRRVAVGLLAAASLTLGAAPAAAATPPERLPLDISLGAEEQFVAGATALTDLTAAQARDIFRQDPKLARQIPVSATFESGSAALPFAPAGDSRYVQYPRRSCWVWSNVKYKSWGGMTLFSFKVAQRWEHNGWRVFPSRMTHSTDTTSWGFLWYFNGIVDAGAYYVPINGRPRGGHHSYRIAQFKSQGGSAVTVNLHNWIRKWYQGGWNIPSKNHVNGCV